MKTQQLTFKRSLLNIALSTTIITSTTISAQTLANETPLTNKSQTIESMLVTANRTPESLSSVLNSVKVFTRDDIEISSAISLGEILNKVNGLQVATNGSAGQQASIFSRGTDSGHTLVLIDGQRINSATLGTTSYAQIPPEQIERIEIIKGPRAALWGSDAIGGVIQIFTRQLSDGEVAANITLGNDDFMQGSASIGIAHGNGSTTFTASSESSNGYDVKQDGETDEDGYSRENISLVGHQQLSDSWKLTWLSKYDQGATDIDYAYGPDKESFENYQLQASLTQNTEHWFQEITLGKQENKSVSYGGGSYAYEKIKESDGDLYKTTRIQASWLGNYQLSDTLSSTLGYDFVNEEVNELSATGETERNNHAVFTRLVYNNTLWILDASVRYDDIEHVDTEVSYNASAGFIASEDTLISLNYATGFKAPSFNDLYYDAYGSVGNPDLKSETSKTTELLAKTKIDVITAEVSLYQTKIDDLIDWVEFAPYSYTPDNINKATIKGMEVSLNATLFGFDHEVQWAYLDAKDDKTDNRLIRRAKNTSSYYISKAWDKLSVQADVQYQGKRQDSRWPGYTTLASHTLMNMSSHYQLSNDWKVSLKVNNVFDKKYDSIDGYTGQGAQYLLGISYNH